MNKLAILALVSVVLLSPFLINDAFAELTFASVVKSADEIVTNSTVLQNDDELFFIANANSTYSFTIQTIVSGEASTNMKIAFTVPSGATMKWHPVIINVGLTPFVSGEVGSGIREERLIFMSGTDPDRLQLTEIYGTVKMGSTSGTVQLQWSQEFASITSTTMFEGSSLQVYESGATVGTSIGLIHTKVTKATDDVVNNSIVFVNDSELFFNGTANKSYSLTLMMLMSSASNADLKMDWTLPSGATGQRIFEDFSWFFGSFPSNTENITDEIAFSTNGQDQQLQFHANINMGSTNGIVNFQFAQVTAQASDTKMLKGTTLLVYEEGTSTLSDIQGLQGEQGIQGVKGDKGDKGSAGSGGGSVGSVPAPAPAPAPALTETQLVELVLAELAPAEPSVFDPIESVVQTFFEFVVIDTTLDQLALNSLVQNERLGIRWSSGQDIAILSVTPASSPFQITFETLPIVKQGSGAVISTDFLLYNLQVPRVQCSIQVTTNCVENVRYEIPVTINAVIGNNQVSDTGTISVDLREGQIDPILLLLLAVFGIPIIGVIIQKARGRSTSIPARRVAGL